jgi:membrane-associated protease RseP (regulator of RpoE activity)
MNANRIIHLLLAVTLCGIVSVPALADEPSKGKEQTEGKVKTVPFKLLESRHIVVEVKVNGKGPFRLVFDTGAPMTLINNRLAKEAGVIKKESGGGFGFNPFGAMGEFTVDEMEMGDLKAKKVACIVMDHPTLEQMAALFGRIDGIVGFPFFAHYRMTVNYQAKEFTFEPNGFKPTNIFERLMKLFEESPAQRNAPKIVAPAGQWGLRATKSSDDDEAGVEIAEVLEKSSAANAGLKVGDRLLTLDGRWTDSVMDLYEAASYVKPGKTVPVQILRKGERLELKVTPANGL